MRVRVLKLLYSHNTMSWGFDLDVIVYVSPTRHMCMQQGINIISFLYKQLQTFNLPPVSCRVHRAVARESDSSLCGDGDESPQGSGGWETEGGRRKTGRERGTEAVKNKWQKTGRREKCSLDCGLNCSVGTDKQRYTEGSLWKELQWKHCRAVSYRERHVLVDSLIRSATKWEEKNVNLSWTISVSLNFLTLLSFWHENIAISIVARWLAVFLLLNAQYQSHSFREFKLTCSMCPSYAALWMGSSEA